MARLGHLEQYLVIQLPPLLGRGRGGRQNKQLKNKVYQAKTHPRQTGVNPGQSPSPQIIVGSKSVLFPFLATYIHRQKRFRVMILSTIPHLSDKDQPEKKTPTRFRRKYVHYPSLPVAFPFPLLPFTLPLSLTPYISNEQSKQEHDISSVKRSCKKPLFFLSPQLFLLVKLFLRLLIPTANCIAVLEPMHLLVQDQYNYTFSLLGSSLITPRACTIGIRVNDDKSGGETKRQQFLET